MPEHHESADRPIVVKFLSRSGGRQSPQIWLRQFPGQRPAWGPCRFVFDLDADRYDWLVVYDDFPSGKGERFPRWREPLACPRDHTLLITAEPSSIKTYGRRFLAQFGHVLTSHEPERLAHPGRIYAQPALRWFYGLGSTRLLTYDEMTAHPPLEKSRLIATVCSAKRQRHTIHRLRYRFTSELKARLPELDVFGHGVRPMDDKAESLDPYRYHVAVENHVAPHHWTEKLADAFLGCALPFYFGCPNADEYFPPESFMAIDIRDPDGAAAIIREAIERDEYNRRLPQILEARRRVLEEHNLFAVLSRLIAPRHDGARRPEPDVVLLSRYAMRRHAPISAVGDWFEKMRHRAHLTFSRST